MPTPTLTLATVADLPVLQPLMAQTYRETFLRADNGADVDLYIQTDYRLEQLTAELLDPEANYYLLRVGTEVAGYLKLNFGAAQSEPDYPDLMEVQRIYVKNGFKGQHLGSLMMDFAIQQAQLHQVPGIWLGVWEHNYAAQGFYQHYGYERIGEHTFMEGNDPQTDFILYKKL